MPSTSPWPAGWTGSSPPTRTSCCSPASTGRRRGSAACGGARAGTFAPSFRSACRRTRASRPSSCVVPVPLGDGRLAVQGGAGRSAGGDRDVRAGQRRRGGSATRDRGSTRASRAGGPGAAVAVSEGRHLRAGAGGPRQPGGGSRCACIRCGLVRAPAGCCDGACRPGVRQRRSPACRGAAAADRPLPGRARAAARRRPQRRDSRSTAAAMQSIELPWQWTWSRAGTNVGATIWVVKRPQGFRVWAVR